jgi:glycosyltransferase involved in cell wall biosynthesis
MNQWGIEKIAFFCPLWGTGTDSGYSYAAVELIKAWQALGIPVWANDTDADVIFNMGQPHFYERVEGKLNIGYTAWESTEISPGWVANMNRMDEIWAPCQANIDWYKAAGVDVPMRVLPHGINPEHWPIRDMAEVPSVDDVYKFIHIGGDAPRKGALMVYDAFKNVFGDQDDVQLTLKGRKFNFNPKGKNITVLNELIPQEELRALYHSHHAMIYPTMGEGFGLVPFQAMATGMPTAVTNWSGPADFWMYGWPIGVHYLTTPTYAPHIGQWAQPKYEDVCYYMVRFYEERKKFNRMARMFAAQMHEECTWEQVAKTALESLSDSLVSMGK